MKNKFDNRYEEIIEETTSSYDMNYMNKKLKDILGNKNLQQGQKVAGVSEIIKEYFLETSNIFTIRESKQTEPEMWIYKQGIYVPCGETYIKEEVMNILSNNFSSGYVNAVLKKLQASTFICIEEFFKEDDPYILPIANGLLNVKTLEVTKFNPEKRFFSKINAMYIKGASCPKIKKFISEVVREQDVPLIQEMFGFCLVRKYFLKKAYMLLGRTDAGKTKLLQLLHSFLGDKNCSSVSLHRLMENNFMTWKLHGKLANISSESSSKSILNDDLFKSLVGDDALTADRKFKEAIGFFNYAKILNACNELPKAYTYDLAFFNRWILTTFPNQFKVKKEYDLCSEEEKKKDKIFLANPNILDDLIDIGEMTGLLNWALEGLQRLLEKGEFSYNKTAEEIKIEWLRESNSFEAFFIDSMEETDNYDFFESKEEIKNEYKKYCKKHKLKIESDKVIKHNLERDHGAYEKRISVKEEVDDDEQATYNRERVWKGVRFNEKINNQ